MQIQLTPNQIATAVMEGDYPDQARNLNAIAQYMHEGDDGHSSQYRWRRHIVGKLNAVGIKFFKGMAEAIAHHEEGQ